MPMLRCVAARHTGCSVVCGCQGSAVEAFFFPSKWRNDSGQKTRTSISTLSFNIPLTPTGIVPTATGRSGPSKTTLELTG